MSKQNTTTTTAGLTPDTCAAGIRRHLVAENSARAIQGYYLLHAQANFSTPPDSRGQGRKSSATVALDCANADSPGFDAWLEEHFSGVISRRTAFNYISAASRLGLTLDMDEAAAAAHLKEALKAWLAGGEKFSALYLPADAGEGEETPPEKSPRLTAAEKAEQLLMPWFDDVARVAVDEKTGDALYSLPMEKLAEAEAKLRAALDTVLAVKKDRAAGGKKGTA